MHSKTAKLAVFAACTALLFGVTVLAHTSGRVYNTKVAISTYSAGSFTSEQDIAVKASTGKIFQIDSDASASTRYDVIIYTKSGEVTNSSSKSIYKIYEYSDANREHHDQVDLSYRNMDSTRADKLYLRINNKDTTNNSSFNVNIVYEPYLSPQR